MAKKKFKKGHKIPYNIFENGGPIGSITSGLSTDISQITQLGQGGASGSVGMQPITPKVGGGFNMGSIGSLGSSSAAMLGSAISNAQIADTSDIEGGIKAQKNMVVGASSNDDLMSEWGAWNKVKDNYSWRDIRGGSTGQRITSTLGSIGQGASSGASVGGPIGAAVGGVVGLGSSIAGIFAGNRKAKRKARQLNKQAKEANERALTSFETRADNVDTQNDFNMLANYSAFGGLLGGGAIDYELANRSLNNKQLDAMSKFRLPSMPNSFTTPVENTGYFAKGGSLGFNYKEDAPMGTLYSGAYGSISNYPKELTNGGVFSDGVSVVREGGSHEENPLTGVPMGIAPDGKPNLVEEGEVIFNNYVFSDRLNLNDNMLKNINLSSKYKDKTFAETAEKLSEESKERPYDPISRRGLHANMAKLMQAQEEVKAKKEKKTEGRQFANGGGPINPAPIFTNHYLENSELPNEIGEFTAYGTTFGNNAPLTKEERDNFAKNTRDYMKSQEAQRNSGLGLDSLRYVPALGAGIGVFTDAMGWTNKPDYSNSDMILNEVSNLPNIEATPIGNYLSYNPFDRDFYINKLNQQTAATRRDLQNTSGGNRLNAQAGILAADYNYGQTMGDLARQAEEYNLAQREKVESFNRGTNQFNSENALRVAGMNQQNKEMKLRAIMHAAGMRDATKSIADESRSANLTTFFNSLGNIGQEEFMRHMANDDPSGKYKISRRGKASYKGKKK